MNEPNRYALKLHAEAAGSPYIGDVLAEHGYWHCDNGVHYARATHPGCQQAHDTIDWLADAKARAKVEIAQRATAALTLSPADQVRQRALVNGGPHIPTPTGYVIMTADAIAAELAAAAASDAACHARCYGLCQQIDAASTMTDLRGVRDAALRPENWLV